MIRLHLLLLLLVITLACRESAGVGEWQLNGFVKQDEVNPILEPDTSTVFHDPISGRLVKWEGKDVFNPASLVRDDTLFLLYRAEDFVGKYNGTSRIGLAYSTDGLHFERYSQPVFFPKEDPYKRYEWEGGAEDPRIVIDEDERYVMTYTAYDGTIARLMIATSKDLLTWQKYGPAFSDLDDINTWSKSGAIIAKMTGQRMVATKVDGRYWMYFGDTDLFLATSDDLVSWNIIKNPDGSWKSILSPRPGKFDSDLIEPGPPAMITNQGILLIYNSRNKSIGGDPDLPEGTYAAGQVLFDPSDPARIKARSDDYFFYPTKDYEKTGQVNNVCFVEGLSFYQGKWFLYYGTADSKIAVAVSKSKMP